MSFALKALKRSMNESGAERHRHLVELSHNATRAKNKLVQVSKYFKSDRILILN